MKRTGVGNGQINIVLLLMCLGVGIGAVISLVFNEIMYMVIGMGIGIVIGFGLKIVMNKKHDQTE